MRFAMLAVLAWAVMSTPTRGLDPSRALTQAIHRIWQTQQGLPHGTIYCVYQTSDRYLWLGTKSGLVRFDGVQFHVLRQLGDVRLENAWIRQLCEDDQGSLWIATDADGLVRWNDGAATRYGAADGLPSTNIRCLFSDRKQNVWVGTERGLARWTDGRFELVALQGGTAIEAIVAICETADGTLWAAGERGRVYAHRDGTLKARLVEKIQPSTAITSLAPAADGGLWIGTAQGLVYLRDDNEQLYPLSEDEENPSVYCLVPGQHASLWIGTSDGFHRFRADKVQSFRTGDGLSQSTVYSICEDHEGSLWVGTKLGLNQFVDRRTIPFTTTEGLASNNTGPIEQDADGTIWVGTLDAGLAQWNGSRFDTWTTERGLPSNSIWALAAGGDGALWVGTDQGLGRLDGQAIAETFTTESGLPSDDIRSLSADRAGRVWIGTAGGLAWWQDGTLQKEPLPIPLAADAPVLALATAEGDSLVAAIERGPLLQRTDGEWSLFDTHGLDPPDVSGLGFVGDRLYVATASDGLYVFTPNRAIHVSVREGLYDNELFGLTSDETGRLWVACSKGVFSIETRDIERYAMGELTAVVTTPLSPLDALRTVECQSHVQPVVKRMQDGRIWFSTIRGALVIDPSHWQRVLPPTQVVVEEVVINGKSENPRRFQTVPPGNANLTFRYAALSYVSPSRITFRYRLEGFDEGWIEAGARREAFYTNIPPGDYRFVVAAWNVDGKQYGALAPVELRISPHLYQAAWFLPACVAIAVLATWLMYRLRVRALRNKMNAIVFERSRIARELHDGLMQGFAGITMEMQALASRLPQASNERLTLEEIIDDAGDCLREARRSIAGLRTAPSALAAAIEHTARQLAQTHDMRLVLRLDPLPQRLSPETEYNLVRIAQEAIMNSLKHSGGSILEVALESTADEVRLVIRDDGQGLRQSDRDFTTAGHYGLLGMRERAHQIGADLSVENGRGRGTAIRVVLPIRPTPTKAVP